MTDIRLYILFIILEMGLKVIYTKLIETINLWGQFLSSTLVTVKRQERKSLLKL